MTPPEISQNNDGINAIFIHSAVDDAGLDPFAFRVLMHLSRRANRKGMAWPGVASIAEVTGISERRVRDALRDLEARKMLMTSQAPGTGNRHQYELTAADEWILEAAPDADLTKAAGGADLKRQEVPGKAARGAVSSTREGNPVEGYPDKAQAPVISGKPKGNSKKFLAPEAGAAILAELGETFSADARFCLRLGEFVAERFKMGRKMTPEACHRMALKFQPYTAETCATAIETSLDRGWVGVFPESVKGDAAKGGAPMSAQSNLEQWGFGQP